MNKTKKRIIETTIRLFNRDGFANVSLPLIAKIVDISLGNLTYHFKKKEDLIEDIYTLFQEELAIITKDYKQLSNLGEMDEQLRDFYEFQQRFRFFYLDLLEIERAYPAIAERHQKHIEGQINGLAKSFIHNAALGNLIKQERPIFYQHLGQQFWLITVFWSMQLAVRGKTGTVEGMKQAAWLLVLPHATEKGRTDFEHIFKTEKIN
ncbi:MAG: TetR/AcrR family transcriptional regulator [Saprospiraceae bacterium]